jgi:hypothetical protein
VTSFYGIDLGDATASAAAPTAEIVRVFELLKPKRATTPLVRIGGDRDGSYLVPEDLDGVSACFSPGANRIKHFEDDLADRYGIASHMCDFTCDADDFTTPLKPGLQTFVKKWLDVEPDGESVSMEGWVREHDPNGDLLLQMDIEGAEFRNLLATSEETLARFRVIVLEVHGLGRMLDTSVLRGVIAPFFRKLAATFTAVHAHPNNCCGDFAVPGTDIRIPNVLELTFLRNDRFVPAPGPAALPHPLDVSRNVPGRAPLFLGDAWCDGGRPLESRVKILEDTQRYRDEVGAASGDREFSAALSMTMQSLQTLRALLVPLPERDGDLVEVAEGRRYELSSAYGTSTRTGVVAPHREYFFHTEFGAGQWIRVDLGGSRRVRRIEVTNRRSGYQERAKYIFALLSDGGGGDSAAHVFPMHEAGRLPGGAWQECAIEIPGVTATHVTITSPMRTALHFSNLRIFAEAEAPPTATGHRTMAGRAAGSARRRIRRLRPRA